MRYIGVRGVCVSALGPYYTIVFMKEKCQYQACDVGHIIRVCASTVPDPASFGTVAQPGHNALPHQGNHRVH